MFHLQMQEWVGGVCVGALSGKDGSGLPHGVSTAMHLPGLQRHEWLSGLAPCGQQAQLLLGITRPCPGQKGQLPAGQKVLRESCLRLVFLWKPSEPGSEGARD